MGWYGVAEFFGVFSFTLRSPFLSNPISEILYNSHTTVHSIAKPDSPCETQIHQRFYITYYRCIKEL
jgi:hypothetical protein